MVQATFALRQFGTNSQVLVVLVALFPCFLVAAALSSLLLIIARSRLGTIAGLVLIALMSVLEIPSYVGRGNAPSKGFNVVVVTGNMRFGMANAADIVATATRASADVLGSPGADAERL